MASKYFLKVDGIESLEIRCDTYNNVIYFLEKFKHKFADNQRFVYDENSYALCTEEEDRPIPDSEYSIEIDYEVFKIIINCMSAQFRL